MDAGLIISVRTWLLTAHGHTVHAQVVLLVVLLPVDRGHVGAGQDEADDAQECEHNTASDVGQQEGGDVSVEPLLHDSKTAVGEDLLMGADVSEDISVLDAAAFRLLKTAGIRDAPLRLVLPRQHHVLRVSVPVSVPRLEVEGAAALEVPLERVPLELDILIHPVQLHLLNHRRLDLKHKT